ncbi:type II secretion system F family protein [Massilia sp. W12]|uniref:type II secretion system F family protein n=1 Tax=Massilia sp. W12 TaxID=3126507 RepID=UPI0030CEC2C4
MPLFTYSAMDSQGAQVRGQMDAVNVLDLELRLRRMELDLIDYQQKRRETISFTTRNIERKDLITFCFHMEQLSAAGVPILSGLTDLRDSTDHPRMREVIADLLENIEGGMQLSEAMAYHPKVFDKTFTSLVTAGEQSGKLPEVFANLTQSLKWQDELSAKTKKLLMYPSFVAVTVIAVTFFLMIYLVPQLTLFIKNMGQQLPLHARALIAVSNFFVNYWYLIMGLPLLLGALTVIAVKTNAQARYRFDAFKLSVWLVGPILHKIILARFATFFGLMYGAGISIIECIRLSEGIVDNEVIATGLRRARQLISEGQGVTSGFETTGIFPPLVLRMLKVGEATGALDNALKNVSYFYNRDISEQIEKVQALIEPVMTVILGLILGWIMLSVLGPIYDTISKIKV